MNLCHHLISGFSARTFILFKASALRLSVLFNNKFIASLLHPTLLIDNPDNKVLYTGFILFLAASLILLIYFLSERIKSKRFRENEKTRNDFFIKLAHEFRTPLTIILGMSKQLKGQKDLGKNSLTFLSAIERQGRHLSDLVNQLLDLANLQTNENKLEWKTGNIIAYVQMISETFGLYAEQKDIELVFYSEENKIETDFVPDYLFKILQNILSNTIKYSDNGSRVFIILERNKKDKKRLMIKVIDQGSGITKTELPYIFDLFYKAPSASDSLSYGIGLTLTKQLIYNLNGTIDVESAEGKGSTFTIGLPINRDEKKLYSHWSPRQNTKQGILEKLPPIENKDIVNLETKKKEERKTILIVEDNKDIYLYISALFNNDKLNILYADNGVTAMEMANEYIPDIVITDIIMPKKNGIELCKDIRSSTLLNHIPIIIISAKNSQSDFLEGFKSGADAYIGKPFTGEELQVRVEKLLESRDKLKEKYLRTIFKEEKNETGNNLNVEFLRKVTDIIHHEIKNPNFSAKKLAHELAISVSQLNKKLNAITGYPSSTYIQQVKIAYAKKLLTRSNKPISEIADMCGIFDVNYFSRIFKKHTGVTPTQYQRLPQD